MNKDRFTNDPSAVESLPVVVAVQDGMVLMYGSALGKQALALGPKNALSVAERLYNAADHILREVYTEEDREKAGISFDAGGQIMRDYVADEL